MNRSLIAGLFLLSRTVFAQWDEWPPREPFYPRPLASEVRGQDRAERHAAREHLKAAEKAKPKKKKVQGTK